MIYGIALFFFGSLFWILSGIGYNNLYHKEAMPDELLYKDISNNFTLDHIRDLYNGHNEMKPITFLTLEKIFNSDIFLTRMLNLIFISINTFLIFKLTKNKLSFIYPIFPVFLNSMWFTVETIEMMFLLLGLLYKEKQGIFTGLAMIFRPYAILYSALLSKKQILNVVIIGILFSVLLLILGLFFPYLFELISYTKKPYDEYDFLAIVVLIMLFIMGSNNKEMLRYSILALIPLSVRLYGHYFLPVYTFLFIGFLLTMNKDFKKLFKNISIFLFKHKYITSKLINYL